MIMPYNNLIQTAMSHHTLIKYKMMLLIQVTCKAVIYAKFISYINILVTLQDYTMLVFEAKYNICLLCMFTGVDHSFM